MDDKGHKGFAQDVQATQNIWKRNRIQDEKGPIMIVSIVPCYAPPISHFSAGAFALSAVVALLTGRRAPCSCSISPTARGDLLDILPSNLGNFVVWPPLPLLERLLVR
jgi:hypothetical protein